MMPKILQMSFIISRKLLLPSVIHLGIIFQTITPKMISIIAPKNIIIIVFEIDNKITSLAHVDDSPCKNQKS